MVKLLELEAEVRAEIAAEREAAKERYGSASSKEGRTNNAEEE
jgi:hypothetical protein